MGEAGLPMAQRIIATILGAARIVAGSVATFVTSNGAGSAALASEQYQALAAAEKLLPGLSGEPLEFLYDALMKQTGPGGWIKETTDR